MMTLRANISYDFSTWKGSEAELEALNIAAGALLDAFALLPQPQAYEMWCAIRRVEIEQSGNRFSSNAMREWWELFNGGRLAPIVHIDGGKT